MQIKLNGLNLNSGNYIVQELQIDEAPPITTSQLDFASFDGAKFTDTRFNPKTLRLSGRITGTTQQQTEANIDNFKKTLLTDPNINLNFSYGAGFRQYVGNVTALSVTREKYQVNYALFDVSFEASDPPFAYEVSSIDAVTPTIVELYSADNWVGNQRSGTFTASGTAQPLVRWRYVLDSVSGTIQQLVFKSITTGKQMELNNSFTAGDVVIIDPESLTVTLNSQPQDYEGVFPEFKLGANEFQWNVYGYVTGVIIDQQQNTFNSNINTNGVRNNYVSQGFKVSTTRIIQAAEVTLRKLSTVQTVGDMTLRIETDNAGVPSGTILTSQEVSTELLSYDATTNTKFLLPNNVTLTAGVQYHLVWNVSGPRVLIMFNYPTGDVYTDGQTNISVNAGSTWSYTAIMAQSDLAFKIYQITTSTDTFDHRSDIRLEAKKRFL